jgi:hypothetical protein
MRWQVWKRCGCGKLYYRGRREWVSCLRCELHGAVYVDFLAPSPAPVELSPVQAQLALDENPVADGDITERTP